jgi:hypothetical protein
VRKNDSDGKKAEGRGRGRQAQVVEELILKVEQRLGGDDVKATVADYIRLVELQKELEEDQVRDIEVRWVDPEDTRQDNAK